VVNNADITFTNKDITFLEKGLKYNLHNRKRNWLSTLALEAETAINSLPHPEREYFRNKVAENLEQLKQHDRNVNRTARSEHNTIKQIITKIQNNKATVTSADKGNTIVILLMQQYQLKIHNFITNNSSQIAKTNPTKTYQNQVRKTINNTTWLIKPEHRWKYVNLNPTEPTIRALIRPIVNWQHAPAYKLAKLLTEKIQQLASLPYAYNIKKKSQLIQELKQTPLTPTSAFASLNITNMYSNIPIEETKHILYNSITHNAIDQHTITELINWYEIVTQQNYFENNDQIILQKDGLAMGAPSSSIISEIFPQNIE